MNILHISDFHYSGDRRILDKIVPAIISAIQASGKQLDFILFTGDLVQNGEIKKHFEEAKRLLYEELCSKLNVAHENIIFCPGNHDIDFNKIRYSHRHLFWNEVKSDADVNNIYKGKGEDQFVFPDSLLPLANYEEFLKSFHQENESNIYHKLYSIHYRMCNKQKIAFVCLYSPWLCNLDSSGGANDYGHLLFPTAVFDELADNIDSDTTQKVLLMHHPISFFRDFNAYEIENQVYDNFDMMFVGHIHKMSNVTRHTGINGIYEHTTKASLSKKEMLGCTIIENDDIEDNRFCVSEITYIKDANECHIGQPIIVTIPIGADKEERNRLRKKVYEKISIEQQNANNLQLLKQEDGGHDFLSSYNTPLIRRNKEDSMSQSAGMPLSLQEIFNTNDNVIVLGKDKCGKTSLLRRIQLEYLMNYTTYNRVPYFLDAKEEEAKVDDCYSLNNSIRGYLGINQRLATELMESDQLVLLVDNYKLGTGFASYLETFMTAHPKAILIAVGEDVISMNYEISMMEFGNDRATQLYYFLDLRKREIIQYIDRQLVNEANKIQIQEKIMKLCKQMELPYNYWTISLFLLIHHKSSDTYSKNLFSILDVCVDEIFDKKKLLLNNSRVSFSQLKSICAMLAKFLFKEHANDIYSATKDQILLFFEEEFDKNKRIVVTPETAFNFFVACGMLKMNPNGYFVFRLNGFFEYFLAYQMTSDEDFKQTVLNDEVMYLGFKNQLEIYSGLRNSDTDFLQFVYNKTNKKCQPIFKDYNENKDAELKLKMDIPRQLEDKCKELSIKNAMSSLQKADLEEMVEDHIPLESDVHLMAKYDPTANSIDLIGRYLSILSCVFKNIDLVDDTKVNASEMFRDILNYYCDFSYYIIDNLSAETEANINTESCSNIDEFQALNVLKLISNFSPLIVQMEVFDGLGHFTLERLIMDEIENLKQDAENNQYKLFILYFTLFDISLNGRDALIDEAINVLKRMPLLRYMMSVKFNYYMAFRSDGNNKLQMMLSGKIRYIQHLLDDKVDSESVDKGIAGMKKDALMNKQKKG